MTKKEAMKRTGNSRSNDFVIYELVEVKGRKRE
jgi:hypothetical protein